MAKTFEIWDLLRNQLIGSTPLLYMLSLFVIIYASFKYKFPKEVMFVFIVIYSITFWSRTVAWLPPLLLAIFLIAVPILKAYDIHFFQTK